MSTVLTCTSVDPHQLGIRARLRYGLRPASCPYAKHGSYGTRLSWRMTAAIHLAGFMRASKYVSKSVYFHERVGFSGAYCMTLA